MLKVIPVNMAIYELINGEKSDLNWGDKGVTSVRSQLIFTFAAALDSDVT